MDVTVATTRHGVLLSGRGRNPCLSLVKPLLFWQFPDIDNWNELAGKAIRRSDNGSTDKAISQIGNVNTVRMQLNCMSPPVQPAHTWGTIELSGIQMLDLYDSLRQDDSVPAQKVRSHMNDVVPEQTLGMVPLWEHLRSQTPQMKAGWDLRGEYLHTAVAIMDCDLTVYVHVSEKLMMKSCNGGKTLRRQTSPQPSSNMNVNIRKLSPKRSSA